MTDATRPIELSIIVPIYNVEPYLQECLDSILEQDLEHYEVLLINDGSTDGSGAIAQKYTEKYPAHFHYSEQQNQGVSITRNQGIQAATGTYLIFVDPDDALETGAVKNMLDLALSSNADILIGNFVHWFADGTFKKNKSIIPTERMSGLEWLSQSLKQRKFLPAIWNKLYKRSLLVTEDLLFKPGITSAEDLLFTIQALIKAPSILCIKQVLYKYRHRAESATTNLSRDHAERRFASHLEVTNNLIDTTEMLPNVIRKRVLERTIKLNLTSIKLLVACNEAPEELAKHFETLDKLRLHHYVRVSRLSHLIGWMKLRVGFRVYFEWRTNGDQIETWQPIDEDNK